jgi:hypothetical protein
VSAVKESGDAERRLVGAVRLDDELAAEVDPELLERLVEIPKKRVGH